jgi:hypothetical protein
MGSEDMAWSGLRAVGDPEDLPSDVRRMLGAVDEESAREARGRIEDSALPQRELYEAAEPVAAAVAAGIRSGVWSAPGLGAALDLLVEIAHGEPSQVEQIEGDEEIGRRCRRIVRDLLPVLYRLGRESWDEGVRLAVVDLAVRLEGSPRVRRELVEAFGGDACGELLLRGLRRLEEGLGSSISDSEYCGGAAWVRQVYGVGSLREVLGLSSRGLTFRRVFCFDVGARRAAVGVSLEFAARPPRRVFDGDSIRVRVVCEGVTGLVVDGPLVLADGVLELEGDEGAWVLRASQKGFRMMVSCRTVRLAP